MNITLKVLGKIKNIVEETIANVQRKTDQQFLALEKWYKEDPHNLRRSTFEDLTINSIVFDLGGYEGQWASDIAARYNCNIYIFEPVKEYAEIIKERFKHNPKIFCFQFGLSDRNFDTEININEFASSTFKSNKRVGKKEMISIKSFNNFLAENQVTHIDLIKINIEGGEYDLLENIIAKRKIHSIEHLLIQFHNFVPEANKRKQAIKAELSKTHKPIFEFEFVWEYWTLKEKENIEECIYLN